MKKQITITRDMGTKEYRAALRDSAFETQSKIAALANSVMPLEFLFKLKFQRTGHDPLNSSRALNLIEQLNQTFTYLASLNAAEYILESLPQINGLVLNLGTLSGWDIESNDDGGLVAEVFASVTPKNNAKLTNDVNRVAAATTRHRYVFFMCPNVPSGRFAHPTANCGLVVWSLGCEL